MPELSPKTAAELAADIYLLQTENQMALFLLHPVFKSSVNNKIAKHLKAEVGGRVLLNYKDGFGICTEGGENNKGEIFLIFRGTTMENKKADVLTDARIGLSRSMTGMPVHCGFQHCFSSMLPAIRNFFTSYKGS